MHCLQTPRECHDSFLAPKLCVFAFITFNYRDTFYSKSKFFIRQVSQNFSIFDSGGQIFY